MNDNIKTGSDIHAGDGGYSIGTKEKYDEFVKSRNQSLGKARIQELAEQADVFEYKTYYDPTFSKSAINDDKVKKFAELIVKECVGVVENLSPGYEDYRNQIEDAFRRDCVEQIKQHFGVEE